MKKINLIARQKIIDPYTKKIYDDEGLRALNGYFQDIVIVDEPFDKMMVVLQYENAHPELKGWDFQITEIK